MKRRSFLIGSMVAPLVALPVAAAVAAVPEIVRPVPVPPLPPAEPKGLYLTIRTLTCEFHRLLAHELGIVGAGYVPWTGQSSIDLMIGKEDLARSLDFVSTKHLLPAAKALGQSVGARRFVEGPLATSENVPSHLSQYRGFSVRGVEAYDLYWDAYRQRFDVLHT